MRTNIHTTNMYLAYHLRNWGDV